MPMCYGGGISSCDQIKAILNAGVEKVVINTHAVENPDFITEASEKFGSQSIVVSLDCRKEKNNTYSLYSRPGTRVVQNDPLSMAAQMEKLGCGEIFINSIDRDGMMQGYDIDLIRSVSATVSVPLIACGGAGSMLHLSEAINLGGASAVAAGSMFVFQGKYHAVLISYPSRKELESGLL